jgi:peptide/nickel transport system ATP-binding protein
VTAPLLRIDDLTLEFRTRGGTVRALDRVGLTLAEGETVGVVGESGSGKSVMAHAVMGLTDRAGRITGGGVEWRGRRIERLPERALRRLRGPEMAMVFQNPRTALNPIRTVGRQLTDVIRAHRPVGRAEAAAEAVAMLRAVRITDPEARMGAYPFELSGGMCQRVMIALALACAPRLVIADEPTTGLDVTTQAVIMDLLAGLAADRGMAALFITHDLALAAEHCDRIVVMHAGQVVETAAPSRLFSAPGHPYTRQLARSTPGPATTIATLETVPGNLPDLAAETLPACRYVHRCPLAEPRCHTDRPPRVARPGGHDIWCWNPA